MNNDYEWFSNPINSRYYLPNLIALLKLEGVGIEVGAGEGHFSEALLERCSLGILYSVDSWRYVPGIEYYDSNNTSQEQHDRNHLSCMARLKRFGERSELLHLASLEASELFTEVDTEVDFVYIDANHQREEVVKDLNAWYPKIRKGGILAGHDYLPDGQYNHGMFGVKSAVDEFTFKHGEKLLVCEEELWPTWYLIKSGER